MLSKLLRCVLYTAIACIGTSAATAEAAPVVLQNATATFSQSIAPPHNLSVSAAIDGIVGGTTFNGWAIGPYITNQTAVFETESDVGFPGGTVLTFTLDHTFIVPHALGRFRLSATTDDRSEFADGLPAGGDVYANWSVLDPLNFAALSGSLMTKLSDYSLLVAENNFLNEVYTVQALTTLIGITGIRLEVLEHPSLPPHSPISNHGPGLSANGSFVLAEFQVDAAPLAPLLQTVPEPSSLLVFTCTFAVIGLARNRRKLWRGMNVG